METGENYRLVDVVCCLLHTALNTDNESQLYRTDFASTCHEHLGVTPTQFLGGRNNTVIANFCQYCAHPASDPSSISQYSI